MKKRIYKSHSHKTINYIWGIIAEIIAALSLQLKGWRILARRWKCPFGEIDLIVKRGNTIAFVEVKARKTEEIGLSSLTEYQWRRIEASADYFMAKRPKFRYCLWSFDAIIVRPYRWPRHFRNIWSP